jgi:O-antigen/teichoic acid export membrane protein
MGIIQRQSIKGISVFVVGALIHFVTMILILPKVASDGDQAVCRVIFSLLLLFSIIGSGGISATILKYFEPWKDNKKVLPTFNFISLVYTVVFTLFMIAFIWITKDIICHYKTADISKLDAGKLAEYYWVLPITCSCFALMYYFEAYSIATHRLTAPAVVKEIFLRVTLLILMLCFVNDWMSLKEFFIGYAITYILALIILIIYCVMVRGYRVGYNTKAMEQVPWKQYLHYSLYIFIAGVAAALMLNSDQIIVYKMLGDKATNLYSLAVTLASMVTLPYKPLSAILIPFINEAWANKNSSKLTEISNESSVNLTAIGVLLTILLISNAQHLLPFLKPQQQAFIVPLIILCGARILDYLTGVSSEMMITSPTYKRLVLFMFISFLCALIGYRILIPIYGATGAAIANGIGLITYNVFKYGHLNKVYALKPIAWVSMYSILLGMLVFGLQLLVPQFNNWMLDLVVRSAVVFIIYVVGMYKFRLAPQFNIAVHKIMNK